MTGPRILTLDIETAPLVTYTWTLYPERLGVEQIIEDWCIISVAWKWLDDPVVHCIHTGGRGKKKVRDDKALLKRLHKLLSEADIVIVQNGKKFDLPKINARMLLQGLPPYPLPRPIDTKEVASRNFDFASNGLEWLAKKLTKVKKLKHKKFPGFELWLQCLADNPEAWKEMAKYNKADVVATEELYLALRGWIPGHPNVANYIDDDNRRCPKCGSPKLNINKRRITQFGEYLQYQCQKCGGYSRGRYTLRNDRRLLHQ